LFHQVPFRRPRSDRCRTPAKSWLASANGVVNGQSVFKHRAGLADVWLSGGAGGTS